MNSRLDMDADRILVAAGAAGRRSLITPQARKRAMAEVRTGLTFCLSLPVAICRKPGGHSTAQPSGPDPLRGLASRTLPGSDASKEPATITPHYSTDWDSFTHVERALVGQVEGHSGPQSRDRTGRLGTTDLAERGLQGRGVLIDLCRHLGPGRHAVGYYTLKRIIDADDIRVEPGDILCLNSGFGDVLRIAGERSTAVEMLPARCAELDGRDERLLRWIEESGCSAIASDSPAVELAPARKGRTRNAQLFPCMSIACSGSA